MWKPNSREVLCIDPHMRGRRADLKGIPRLQNRCFPVKLPVHPALQAIRTAIQQASWTPA